MDRHFDLWMRSHPGINTTIYDLPGIVAMAWPQAVTPVNVTSGFRCTGIWPFNPDVFDDDDFAPASVTDRPEPSELEGRSSGQSILGSESAAPDSSPSEPSPSTPPGSSAMIHAVSTPAPYGAGAPAEKTVGDSQRGTEPSGSAAVCSSPAEPSLSAFKSAFNPQEVRPFPKAGERKTNKRPKKLSVNAVVTDTPVKQALQDEAERRTQRKQVKRKIATPGPNAPPTKAKRSSKSSKKNFS
ncbi:uncharacterized protein LOC115354206 [Myripristis murdjan]|uniref:uncharacterized protein LOC115354206 n=1 Tax=Myripristis murdjan TaxID=586833 RepID=UPI0011761DB4|nr:uncharacterized protein LOC115354206 [Myripristis murdjan]